MKAVWYQKTGMAAEVLRFGELEKPVPGYGEVLVRLYASGVNPSDVKARANTRAGGSGMSYPQIIPHSDGAGIIEVVGDGVPESWIHTRVWVWNAQWGRSSGTAAEYITIDVKQVMPLPENISFDVGASLGIPAMTASHCVYGNGEVEGKTILVSGGTGTVGRLIVQFAKIGGAHVIATANGETNLNRAREAGADQVIDFTEPNLTEKILDANSGLPVDRIIEVEFGVNVEVNSVVIKPRGHIVTYGSALSHRPELPFYSLMFKGINLEFVLVYLLTKEERRLAAERVNAAITDKTLDVPIHKVFTLKQCAEAHECVERGGRKGAVVIRID